MTKPNFKILLIDTDTEVLSSVELALKAEGFSVITSQNSREAITLASSELPHLVLVDLLMPELDGIDICIELRHKTELENTLIVFHTERNVARNQASVLCGLGPTGSLVILSPQNIPFPSPK